MDINKYLEENQPIAYRIFSNALKYDRIFHAYLLSGPIGTPLLEIAKHLAKCFITKSKNIQIEENETTKRIDEGNYIDFLSIDGKSSTIKIDDIRKIELKFSKTSIEEGEIKIYIINAIENMSLDAINALLKFLEEPFENTYAILTTENENSILPTIKSRTEIIHFSSINQKQLITDSLNIGVSQNDAEILSFFYNDKDLIKEISSSTNYKETINQCLNFINSLSNYDEARFLLEKDIVKKIKDKFSFRLFIDFLILFFKEAINYSLNNETLLSSFTNELSFLINNFKNLDDVTLKLMNIRFELNYNLNTTLLLIKLVNEIFGV